MNVRVCLSFCAALSLSAPSISRAQTAPSAELRARLRATALQLAPQLTDDGANPGDEGLALALAQLGDEAASNRLTSAQSTRDSIAQWRVEQRALRGDYAGAGAAAARVQSDAVRADCYLVIARLAADGGDKKGEIKGADQVAARGALEAAMRVLKAAPNAKQLAYAGWMWWHLGDTATARRFFIETWPIAEREDARQAKEFGMKEEPDSPFTQKAVILQFAARAGLLADVLSATDPKAKLAPDWLADRVLTLSDAQFLAARLQKRKPTDVQSLYWLAAVMAHQGQTTFARELRDRADAEKPGYVGYGQLYLAGELGDMATLDKLAPRWARQVAASPQDASELRSLPQFVRAFTFVRDQDDRFQLREGAAPAAVNAYADALVRSPGTPPAVAFPLLLEYYAKRDPKRTRALAQSVARQIARDAAQFALDKEKTGSSSWSVAPTKIAAMLRRNGYEAESKAIVNALIGDTPEVFRLWQAQQFLSNGLPDAARQTFDPLPRLQNQTKPQRTDYNFGDFAQTQARFLAPDAPARWFDAVTKPRERAQVLQSWVAGFSPELKLRAPFVRCEIEFRNGSASFTSGGSY